MVTIQFYHFKLVSLQFLIISLLWVSGCTLKPISREKHELYKKPEMYDDLVGKIEIDQDQEAVLDYTTEQVRSRIIRDFELSGKKYVEKEDGPILSFKFYKCEDTGYSPTQSKGANIVIHWATAFLWPIWTYKSCKATLSILDNKTKSVLKKYAANVDAKDGGQLFLYILFPFETDADGIRELAARRLIQQYQNPSSSEKSP